LPPTGADGGRCNPLPVRPACVQLADYQEALFQTPGPEPYPIAQIKDRISVRGLDALHVETLATAFKGAAAGGAGIGFLAVSHFMARVCSTLS